MKVRMPQLPAMPLVGRNAELQLIRAALDSAQAGKGSTLILAGEGGVGKSRLIRASEEEATLRGWTVAVGRGYPVEVGSPYALFSDAIGGALRRMPAETQRVLTRGSAELERILPSLGSSNLAGSSDSLPDFKANLLWNFTQFTRSLSQRSPLLIILEDLQWADSASLELLHFAARQTTAERIVFLCTYNTTHRDDNAALPLLEQSLLSLNVATLHNLRPLSRAGTSELICRVFDADEQTVREFVALVYGWTRGNPFFVEEVLKAVVAAGRIYPEGDHWAGWQLTELELPQSVRHGVLARVAQLSPEARAMAELLAVVGTHITFDLLTHVANVAEPQLLAAIYELRRARMIIEETDHDEIVYDFTHPLVREVFTNELGPTRRRVVHQELAQALERYYGGDALAHADELAYHFRQARSRTLDEKAITYLTAAGRNALVKNANREAAGYLADALERIDRSAEAQADQRIRVTVDLAQAKQRLGDYDAALALWSRARGDAEQRGDLAAVAAIVRRMGLSSFWSGRFGDALQQYEDALNAARAAGDVAMEVKIEVAAAMCLQELGQPDDAVKGLQRALALAQRTDAPALLARVNRALLIVHTWMGPPDQARAYGQRAIELAAQIGDPMIAWSAHWSMAVLEGMTGNAARMEEELAEGRKLAAELRSPLLGLWMDELEIEYTYAKGDWEAAISLAERDIALARLFQQRTLLPRLLVWVGLVYLARGEFEKAKTYIDEAWETSSASSETVQDVHSVVPAHLGRAAYHLAKGEWEESVRIGLAGLRIADRSGYIPWGIHRLIPVIAESYLWLDQYEKARAMGNRLRRDSERIGHKIGLAWADACDALVDSLEGDLETGPARMRAAAEALEAIPFVPDAVRLRRELAYRLFKAERHEEGLRELRHVHDVLTRLGAEQELERTRENFRQIGKRPPARTANNGFEALTERELEIVRLVAEQKSNKAIGKTLGISARTVSTHLTNVFRKLEIESRDDLSELIRTNVITREQLTVAAGR